LAGEVTVCTYGLVITGTTSAFCTNGLAIIEVKGVWDTGIAITVVAFV